MDVRGGLVSIQRFSKWGCSPWPPLLRAVAADSWALGARMQSTNHPSFLSLGGEGNISKWTIVIWWQRPVFLGVCYTPPRHFSSSLCLCVNIHPSSTPTRAPLHSGVHTLLQHTHMHTQGIHFKAIYCNPSMDTVTQRRMKPSLCPWLCTRGNTQSSGEKGLVQINMCDVTWPSRLPWCYSRQPNTFLRSTWQRCQPPSGVTFTGLRATLCLSHPHSRPWPSFPIKSPKNLPHSPWLIFSWPPVLTYSFWTYMEATE